MDADILIVFVQDVLKLVHVWNLNVVEHRNIVLENNLVVGTQLWMDKCISIRFVSPPTVLFEQKYRYRDWFHSTGINHNLVCTDVAAVIIQLSFCYQFTILFV